MGSSKIVVVVRRDAAPGRMVAWSAFAATAGMILAGSAVYLGLDNDADAAGRVIVATHAARVHVKPATLRPPPVATPAAVTAPIPDAAPPARVDDAALGSMLSTRHAAVKRCHDVAVMRRVASGDERVELSVRLATDGRVERVSIGGRHGAYSLGSCLHDEIARWTFPAAAAGAPPVELHSSLILVAGDR